MRRKSSARAFSSSMAAISCNACMPVNTTRGQISDLLGLARYGGGGACHVDSRHRGGISVVIVGLEILLVLLKVVSVLVRSQRRSLVEQSRGVMWCDHAHLGLLCT